MSPEMLYALRDQAGIPAHPLIFLALGVLTFALHMVAVQVMLGAASLTLWGAFQRDQQWRRLASAMLTTAKIAVSVAIVLGVTSARIVFGASPMRTKALANEACMLSALPASRSTRWPCVKAR